MLHLVLNDSEIQALRDSGLISSDSPSTEELEAAVYQAIFDNEFRRTHAGFRYSFECQLTGGDIIHPDTGFTAFTTGETIEVLTNDFKDFYGWDSRMGAVYLYPEDFTDGSLKALNIPDNVLDAALSDNCKDMDMSVKPFFEEYALNNTNGKYSVQKKNESEQPQLF